MTDPTHSPTAPRSPLLRVRIERRGGFAGMRASAQCECAALTPGQRASLEALVSRSPASAGTGAGADRFGFRIEAVHEDGSSQVIEVSEESMPEELQALVKPTLP
jgi:hypothetical protein